MRYGGQTLKNKVWSEWGGRRGRYSKWHDNEALEIDYVEVCEQDEKSVRSKENGRGHAER